MSLIRPGSSVTRRNVEAPPLAAEPRLASYHYLAAARAEFLRRLGRDDEAALAASEALLLAENATERAFLSSGP